MPSVAYWVISLTTGYSFCLYLSSNTWSKVDSAPLVNISLTWISTSFINLSIWKWLFAWLRLKNYTGVKTGKQLNNHTLRNPFLATDITSCISKWRNKYIKNNIMKNNKTCWVVVKPVANQCPSVVWAHLAPLIGAELHATTSEASWLHQMEYMHLAKSQFVVEHVHLPDLGAKRDRIVDMCYHGHSEIQV